ncbi:MAG: tetratricopeptide repeat protein [Candidatus Obscuribacter sp.]|nr:tetratricopeptide repeat protein [Candidatus Obscuribacter sp.]MBK9281689.1 tetratricopeptide repeat protein [Candidatus Obscuribacter sp.]
MQRKNPGYPVLKNAWTTTVVLIIGLASSAYSAELSDRALSSKIDLLDGRLTIDMPSGTVSDSHCHAKGTKVASEVIQKETRASVTAGRQRLDLSVRELFATSGKNFDGSAIKVLQPKPTEGNSNFSLRTSKSGLRMCQATTKVAAKAGTGSQVVNTAIVENSDGTVQLITISVNSEAARDWKAVSTMAERILNSIAPGTKTLPTISRKIEIDTFYGLVASVPDGIATNCFESADFHVFTFNKLHELSSPAAYLSIYIGQHPSYTPKDPNTGRPGSILNQSIRWQEEHQNSMHAAQTLVPLEGTPTILHIFCVASTPEEISDLIKIAETLSVSENAPANQPTQKAFLLYVSNKLREAVAVCDAALKFAPRNKDLLRVRADSHIKLKEYQLASEDYTALISLNKKAIGNIINRAKCFYELGKYQNTVEDCNKAIEANLTGNAALILRAQANTQLKKFRDAHRDLEKAIQSDPEHPSGYIARAQLYRVEGAYSKAIEDCTKANSLWETDEALIERAFNYEKIGQKDLAEKDRSRAAEITKGPSNSNWPW